MIRDDDPDRPSVAGGSAGRGGSATGTDDADSAAGPTGAGYQGPLAALRGLLARPLASYYLLVASASLLLTLGLVMVFSATSVEAYAQEGNAYAFVAKQALFALIGLVAFWIFQRLPVRTYRALGFPLLVVSCLLLTMLDIMAVIGAVSTRAGGDVQPVQLGPIRGDGMWLYLGPFQLQPSEMAKLGLALWVAGVLASRGRSIIEWRRLAYPLFPVAAVTLILVGINDLGTMLCILILFMAMLWAAGVRIRFFVTMMGAALAGIGLLVALPGKQSYRTARFTSFLNPGRCDEAINRTKDFCYQAVEGRYAIANGGWFGVGLGEGKLKWGWLPNGRNDFIFAVIAEELGVVGCFVVLILLLVLGYTGLRIARRVDDPFRSLVATGVTMWLVGQSTINIGGVVGLLPITGVPLPFISDGGTALVVTLAAMGVLASFARAEPDAARALHARPPGPWVRLLWAPLPPLPRMRRTSTTVRAARDGGRPRNPATSTGARVTAARTTAGRGASGRLSGSTGARLPGTRGSTGSRLAGAVRSPGSSGRTGRRDGTSGSERRR